jgi:hypothetical protein
MTIPNLGATKSDTLAIKGKALGAVRNDEFHHGNLFGGMLTNVTFVGLGFGISCGAYISQTTHDTTNVDLELDKCQAAGCEWVRVVVSENTPSEDRLDYIQSGARSRGMSVMAVVRGTSSPYGTPSSAATFATTLITRFGQNIRIWEWGNEPNLPHGATRYTPAQYGAELAYAYDAFKAVDPNCIVCAGALGLSVAGDISGWWPSVLTGGGSGKFDCVSVHSYRDPTNSPIVWNECYGINSESKPIIGSEAGGAVGIHAADRTEQSTIVQHAMQDSRPVAIAIHCMMPEESTAYAILDSSHNAYPAYTLYHTEATS